MTHEIYRVTKFTIVAPYTLEIAFDDQSEQRIDFRPILAGELYAPLRDIDIFNQVELDPEVHTLVWPNGADFDPATLHNWPQLKEAMIERAKIREAEEAEDVFDEDTIADGHGSDDARDGTRRTDRICQVHATLPVKDDPLASGIVCAADR